jgi:hypothetical protein
VGAFNLPAPAILDRSFGLASAPARGCACGEAIPALVFRLNYSWRASQPFDVAAAVVDHCGPHHSA